MSEHGIRANHRRGAKAQVKDRVTGEIVFEITKDQVNAKLLDGDGELSATDATPEGAITALVKKIVGVLP